MPNKIAVVTSWEDFRERWQGGEKRQNFLIRDAMFPFQFAPPPLEEVLDAVRANESTRIQKTRPDASFFTGSAKFEPYPQFRDLPLDEAMRASTGEGVNIAHFDARDFAAPGQVFDGLNAIFDQWYESLAQHGFSWNEASAQRAFFYSAPHCNTGYHFDSSYVLVCQVVGRKRFCWLKEPDRWLPREVIRENADKYEGMMRPESITPHDVIECEMKPGDVLWNVMLTPHWVYALDESTYSFNLTHFDFACDGQVSPMEEVLREIRRERAQQHELIAA